MAEAPPAAAAPVQSAPRSEHAPSLYLAYAATVTMAVTPIYIGAWLALYRKHAPKDKDEPKAFIYY